MKAINTIINGFVSLPPLLRTATPSATAIDLSNCNENKIEFICGALTDGTYTPKLQECATSGGTYTDVAAADQVGSLVAMTANSIQAISYIGKLGFVKPVITVTGSPATGANLCVVAQLKKKKQS